MIIYNKIIIIMHIPWVQGVRSSELILQLFVGVQKPGKQEKALGKGCTWGLGVHHPRSASKTSPRAPGVPRPALGSPLRASSAAQWPGFLPARVRTAQSGPGAPGSLLHPTGTDARMAKVVFHLSGFGQEAAGEVGG